MNSKKSFNEKCYEVLRKVPKGKVTTYKAIARKLKSKGYRAVGNAMNKNPYNSQLRTGKGKINFSLPRNCSAPNVPCHRVICSDGKIGGFAHGQKKKIEMLKKEGVEVVDGKIDLKKYSYKL